MLERFERLSVVALGLIAGCRAYEPSPVDWAKENAVWMEKGELAFASPDDVARVALVGNADLNLMRLKRASSERVARESGWWEDPELDIDLLRIVNPAENPFLGGASLAFTIPLSGVKGLERLTAEAYSAADAADIIVAERETACAARSATVRFLAAEGTVRTLRAFEGDGRIAEAFAAAEKLSESGELSKTETASARLRRHQRVHRLRAAESELAESERALRQLLGVAPDVKMKFEKAWKVDGAGIVERFEKNTPVDYVRHPRVKAALCRLEGGERALETEIHRQYPDLKFGPAYSREEGLDRFGIVAGLTLPLWNRNRKGIAEAEGARNEAKQTAIGIWRDVVLEADAARRTLVRLMDHPPEAKPNKSDADVLSDAGEINPLEYLAIREESLDGELMEADWRRDVRLAEENLKKYEVEEKQ